MKLTNKRKCTRGAAWKGTIAHLTMDDPYAPGGRLKIEIKGDVENIGSSGMFLATKEYVSVPASADILILFDPFDNAPEFTLKAKGRTVRRGKSGVGIAFTLIDLEKLKRCIIHKINQTNQKTEQEEIHPATPYRKRSCI